MNDVEKEDRIRADVARIRIEYPAAHGYRDQLRALLTTLFFNYGERPGAGRLVALLSQEGRSPSTSTAQDEINKFWEQLRQNAKVRLHRPDLPDALLELFADVAGQVWHASIGHAGEAFQRQRQNAEEQVAQARASLVGLAQERDAAHTAALDAQAAAERAEAQRNAAAEQLAAERARLHAVQQTVSDLTERLATEQRLRREESARTQQVMAELRATVEQATREQNRLLTVGDDFKQQAARDRELRDRAEAARDALAAEQARLRAAMTDLSRENGLLEGQVSVMNQQISQLQHELGQSSSPSPATARTRVRRLRSQPRKR